MKPSPPVRLLASRTRHSRALDRPRLFCAATTAAGLIALGALTTAAAPAPAALGQSIASHARTATGDSPPLHAALPPSGTPTAVSASSPSSKNSGSTSAVVPVGRNELPPLVWAAYLHAERSVTASDPSCHLAWQMLAGIGAVESGQADNGNLTPDGTTRTRILGPALDGTGGNAAIPSPGGGWVRAEGPMQFLPSSWAQWGADGNGDGVADPNNIFDSALAAGHYLCAGSRDLAQPAGLDAAILSYNHSPSYLATVTAWITYYQHNPGIGPGSVPSADGSGKASASSRPSPSSSQRRPTASPTPTSTPEPSRSASPSSRPSPSASPSRTASPSSPPSASGPACPTTSPTPTGSGSATPTPTDTPTPSPSPTSTSSGIASPSPSPTSCTTPAGTPTPPSSSRPSP